MAESAGKILESCRTGDAGVEMGEAYANLCKLCQIAY